MKNRKGLTLVEVVIALAVFMIAVVMVYPIITFAGKSNIESKNKLDLQETGSHVAENLAYIARNYSSKDSFLSSQYLEDYGICPDKELACDDDVVVGSFSRANNTQYSLNYEGQEITLEFEEDSNIVKIKVQDKNQKYETLEWLRYEE